MDQVELDIKQTVSDTADIFKKRKITSLHLN